MKYLLFILGIITCCSDDPSMHLIGIIAISISVVSIVLTIDKKNHEQKNKGHYFEE